jgi:hypothetical protein
MLATLDSPQDFSYPSAYTEKSISEVRFWSETKLEPILHEIDVPEIFIDNQPESLYPFLAKHQEVYHVVCEASGILTAYFPQSEFSLDVQTDPDDNSQTLFVLIHHQNDYDTSREQLKRFDEDWFLSKLHDGRIPVNFILDP